MPGPLPAVVGLEYAKKLSCWGRCAWSKVEGCCWHHQMFFLKRSWCHLMPSYALRMNWIIWSSHFHLGLIYTRFHSKIIKNHPSFSSAPRVPWSQVANVPIPCAADSFWGTSCWNLCATFVHRFCGIVWNPTPIYPRPKIKYAKIN